MRRASIKSRADHIARPPPCQPADPYRRSWAATSAKNRRTEAAPNGGSACGYAKTCSPHLTGRQRYARATSASSPGPGTLRLSRSSWRRPGAHPAAARRYAVRSDHARTRPAAPVHGCGPKSPDSHRVVWGLISRPPASRPGFPPVSRLPTRALPLRPPSSGFPSSGALRFRPFGRRCPVRFPVGFPPGPLPLEQPSR